MRAKVKGANGVVVEGDLVGLAPGPRQLLVMAVAVGDADKDGQVDVEAAGYAVLPVIPNVELPPKVLNVPVDQALTLAQAAAPALAAVPGVGAAAAEGLKGLVALVRVALRRF